MSKRRAKAWLATAFSLGRVGLNEAIKAEKQLNAACAQLNAKDNARRIEKARKQGRKRRR